MKTTAKLVGLGLMMLALLSIPALADHHEGAQDEGAMDMEAMMAAMQKLSQPSDCHKAMGSTVGSFDVTMTMYPGPGAPPIESTGTMEGEWILGERFVQTVYNSEIMGQPFEGRGIDGYDNQTEEYTGIWMDSMGTYTTIFKGECDLESTSRSMAGTMMDPTGNKIKTRGVTTETDTGYTYESYVVTDQGEFKNFELVATRK